MEDEEDEKEEDEEDDDEDEEDDVHLLGDFGILEGVLFVSVTDIHPESNINDNDNNITSFDVKLYHPFLIEGAKTIC